MKLKSIKSRPKPNASRSLYLLGNPNVGKSTVFNAMTGLKQHTGNWSGKTVDAAFGKYTYKDTEYKLIDLPGAHSVVSCFSEESVTGNEIGNSPDGLKNSLTLVLADAAAPKRGVALALEYLEKCGGNAVLCINMCDIADKKGIKINFKRLEMRLGIPVIGITAKRKSEINALKDLIDRSFDKYSDFTMPLCSKSGYNKDSAKSRLNSADKIIDECVSFSPEGNSRNLGRRFDKIITSKRFGIPIMLLLLALILWLTVFGSNYPSALLSRLFSVIKPYLAAFVDYIGLPAFLCGIICDGIYGTVTWILAVMMPPMAIFFPLFTLLEDLGLLPRIAFNLDKYYARVNMCGKQCLTQCMGLGCNSVGVTGCRIMPNEKQRAVAILTNCFMPCNGRFALLIALSTIFVGSLAPSYFSGLIPMLCILLLICLSVIVTWCVSFILTKTIYKNDEDIFALELPEYRKPEIVKTLAVSLVNRTASIVGRAMLIAAPTGIVVWLMANLNIGDTTMLTYISRLLDPLGRFIGVDGFIIVAFILSLPANEITLPILIMGYMATGSMAEIGDMESLKTILTDNGWTIITAINMMLLTMFHWPCATTLTTIYHETKSKKILLLSIMLPCTAGVILCIIVKYGYMLINIMLGL